eukprot:3897833-Rhodomonas_salina.1
MTCTRCYPGADADLTCWRTRGAATEHDGVDAGDAEHDDADAAATEHDDDDAGSRSVMVSMLAGSMNGEGVDDAASEHAGVDDAVSMMLAQRGMCCPRPDTQPRDDAPAAP